MTPLNVPGWNPVWDPRPASERTGSVAVARPAPGVGKRERPSAWVEAWSLKLTDARQQRCLMLRFSFLVSNNGFRRQVECSALSFERAANRDAARVALKQTHDLSEFAIVEQGGNQVLRFGGCELSPELARGRIQSKNRQVEWDLRIERGFPSTFQHLPERLLKLGVVRNTAETLDEDLRVIGKLTIDGEPFEWTQATGMFSHTSGPRLPHSWVSSHCNSFATEAGEPTPFIFEGFAGYLQMGALGRTPRLASFYFFHKGEHYRFNSLWESLRVRSRHELTGWEFQADRGELSFRGQLRAELKDFAGVALEDTNGSYVYASIAGLSDLRIQVYRRGKIESSYSASGGASYEVADRAKNPYVRMLL